MLAKIFGSLSKAQYEKWIGIIGLFGILWCGALSIAMFIFNQTVKFPVFPEPFFIVGLSGAIYSLFVFMWSLFIGKGKFSKFYYLKIATIAWIAIDASALLAVGYSVPAFYDDKIGHVVILFLIVNLIGGAALIYFILSKIEIYALDR